MAFCSRQVAMKSWFEHLKQRWNDWCGDRDMEIAIRKHMTDSGFYGQTAKIQNVRLVAVQRPGWLQVYRFEAMVRAKPVNEHESEPSEPQYRYVSGLVKDDIRFKVQTVRTFTSERDRRACFAQWTDGLICLRGAQGLVASDRIS